MVKFLINALFLVFISYTQEISRDTTFNTSFGVLKLLNKNSVGKTDIFFNNQQINNPFNYGSPIYLGNFNKNINPYDEILILQESGVGQACNDIGNLYFLGINKTGNASFLKDSIEVCGADPIIDNGNNKILINPIIVEAGQFGYVPGEVWKYSNGRFLKIDSNPPVVITFRKATLNKSYVVQIKNFTQDSLNLWFLSLGKKTSFISLPEIPQEFGWLEGYSIGANNSVSVGGDGFATIKCFPPSIELSNIKLFFTDEGIGFSLSQDFLQNEANDFFKPMKKTWLQIFNAELNNAPVIILTENSERIFAKAKISISFLIGLVNYDIDVEASGIPYFNSELKGIFLNNIKIENINFNLVPKDKIDGIREISNQFLNVFLSSYCLKKFDENDWKLKMVKGIAVKNGRLVILFNLL